MTNLMKRVLINSRLNIHKSFQFNTLCRSTMIQSHSFHHFMKSPYHFGKNMLYTSNFKPINFINNTKKQELMQKRLLSANSRLKKWKITGTKHKGQSFKTRQAVAKRFIITGKGRLKRGHMGKRHNTSHKTSVRKRRLNKLDILSGTMAKNMHMMILGKKK